MSGLPLFQEIRTLNFEKTSGSDIDVCFVFATIKKNKKILAHVEAKSIEIRLRVLVFRPN